MTRATPIGLVFSLTLALGACARSPVPADGNALSAAETDPTALGPGTLLPPSDVPYDFSWRQAVTINWGEGEQGFEAVLQKQGDTLQLVGLGPMGRPGFVITQDPDGVTLDNRSGRELPFEPEYMLADVQRVTFPWSSAPEAGFEGTRSFEAVDVGVTETYVAGELVERTFVRLLAPERGVATVRYLGWDGDAPSEAVLDNGWFGYELRVTTLSQERL